MDASRVVFVFLVTSLTALVQTTPTAQPRFHDAIVVEAAEGRAESDHTTPPIPLSAAECAQPAESGHCRGYFPYYHFDAEQGRCRKFTWSGCGGNTNRFKSEAECQSSCGHLNQPQPTPSSPHGHYQEEDVQQGGPGGANGPNNGVQCSWDRPPACDRGCFLVNEPKTDCPACECSEEVRRRLCAQPPSRGHCRALLTRWRYDPAHGDCAPFKFGGCDGNANNFRSKEQCLHTCSPHTYEGRNN